MSIFWHPPLLFYCYPRLYTLHTTPYTITFIKIPFPCTLYICSVLKTKDEPRWMSATERTPSIAPEKSPLWGLSAIHRMARPYGVPDQFRELVGCWIAVTQPYGYRVVPYRVGTTAECVMFGVLTCKILFLKISPLLYLASAHRPTTDRRPRELRKKTLWIKKHFS